MAIRRSLSPRQLDERVLHSHHGREHLLGRLDAWFERRAVV